MKETLDLITGLLTENDGVFIGESHGEYAHAEFVATASHALSEAGVTTFYFELVPANESWRLACWQESQDSGPLKSWFNDQTLTFAKEMWRKYEEMLKALDNAGIRIVGIDNRDMPRDETCNRFWADIIIKDQEVCSGKYLGYGGCAHLRHDYDGVANKPVQDFLGIPAVSLHRGDEERVRQIFAGVYAATLPASPDQTAVSKHIYSLQPDSS